MGDSHDRWGRHEPFVLITVPTLDSEAGGVPRSAVNLASALAAESVQVGMVSTKAISPTGSEVMPDPRVTVRFAAPGSLGRPLHWGAAVRDALDASVPPGTSAVIHDFGLWRPFHRRVAGFARAAGIPRIQSPCGMLAPAARRSRAFRKAIAWYLYQYRDLATAAALFATSDQEARDIRAARLLQPIAVIPNGMLWPPGVTSARAARRIQRPRTALFLGRVSPIKNLELLLDVWRAVRPVGWHLVIAGPDDRGHTAALSVRAARLGIRDEVSFPGPASDEAKWALYRAAELLVLPSHSESFGQVVAEALACEVPVLTTRGTPWSGLVHYRCGWWVEASAAGLMHALSGATQQSPDELARMGARGARWVRATYSWPAAADAAAAVYRWLVGGGAVPPCVRLA